MGTIYDFPLLYFHLLLIGDSEVSTATWYGLEGLQIESRWERHFAHRPHRAWSPPDLL